MESEIAKVASSLRSESSRPVNSVGVQRSRRTSGRNETPSRFARNCSAPVRACQTPDQVPGSPGTGVLNTYTVAPAPGTADFALNTLDSSADQYALGVKYHFSPFVSWYLVGSYLRNGPGAHYCLGVSGHGYGVCGRDANNNVIAGNKTEAVTTGMTFDF